MIKFRNFAVALLIAAAFGSTGCSVFKKGARPKTPVLGQRIAVLTTEGNVAVDPATQALPFSLPPATENNAWTEAGGNAGNSMAIWRSAPPCSPPSRCSRDGGAA